MRTQSPLLEDQGALDLIRDTVRKGLEKLNEAGSRRERISSYVPFCQIKERAANIAMAVAAMLDEMFDEDTDPNGGLDEPGEPT